MWDVNPLGIEMHLRELERQAAPKLAIEGSATPIGRPLPVSINGARPFAAFRRLAAALVGGPLRAGPFHAAGDGR